MQRLAVRGLRRVPDGHAVRAGAEVPGLMGHDGSTTLWVGPYTTVQGAIHYAGSVVLGRGSVTWGPVVGGVEVIVGAGCTISGDVRAMGRVVVQDGAKVEGRILAGSDVDLLGTCHVHDVHCRGDICIVGAPVTGDLRPDGRVQSRPW